MNTFTTLEELYRYVTVTHGFTGLVGKFTVLLMMYFLHTGNERPGRRILSGVLAWHFVMGIAFLGGLGATSHALRAACLAALVPLVLAVMRDDVPWRILPEGSGPHASAIGAYALALVFPFWSGRGFLESVLFSPLGALPHQTLAFLSTLLIVTGLRAGWPLIGGTFAATLLIGSIDVLSAGRLSGWVLLAAAAALGARFLAPLALGELVDNSSTEPSAPSVAAASAPPPAPKSASASGGKKWDLR